MALCEFPAWKITSMESMLSMLHNKLPKARHYLTVAVGQESRHGQLGFLLHGFNRAVTQVPIHCLLIWRLNCRRIQFQVHSAYWQNSFPRGYRTWTFWVCFVCFVLLVGYCLEATSSKRLSTGLCHGVCPVRAGFTTWWLDSSRLAGEWELVG